MSKLIKTQEQNSKEKYAEQTIKCKVQCAFDDTGRRLPFCIPPCNYYSCNCILTGCGVGFYWHMIVPDSPG